MPEHTEKENEIIERIERALESDGTIPLIGLDPVTQKHRRNPKFTFSPGDIITFDRQANIVPVEGHDGYPVGVVLHSDDQFITIQIRR